MNDPYLKRNVYLADWSSTWVSKFECEKKYLKNILGENCLGIKHIGSTAIQGMKAKPIIDILVIVSSHKLLDKLKLEIYEVKGENGVSGRRYFQKNENGERVVHIHAYEEGDPAIKSHLNFRDILRSSPLIANEYEQLKSRLAEEFKFNKIAYTNSKTDFIITALKNV